MRLALVLICVATARHRKYNHEITVMVKLIFIILITVLLVHSLAILGLFGYGAATGHFDAEKREQYLATWRGEKLVPEPEEKETVTEAEAPQESGARIALLEVQREIITRETQRDIQLLRSRQETLTMEREKLAEDIQALQEREVSFQKMVDEYNQKAQEEGFRKALKNYSQMKPKMVKDDFMQMEDADVVRYLGEMKSEVATKILEQFKTEQEQQKRLAVMSLLEEYRVVKLDRNDQGKIR